MAGIARFTILVLAMVAGQEIEDSGMKLAMLTCLTGLLEAKCQELEGEGGTGRLERDQQLLEAAEKSGGVPSSQHMLPLWPKVALLRAPLSMYNFQSLRNSEQSLW